MYQFQGTTSKVPLPAISQANDCAFYCVLGDQNTWKDLNRFFITDFEDREDVIEYVALMNQIINLADGEDHDEEIPFGWFCILMKMWRRKKMRNMRTSTLVYFCKTRMMISLMMIALMIMIVKTMRRKNFP